MARFIELEGQDAISSILFLLGITTGNTISVIRKLAEASSKRVSNLATLFLEVSIVNPLVKVSGDNKKCSCTIMRGYCLD